MSPTDQQSSAPAPAPADAQVPSEHEVPEDLGLAAGFPGVTRDEWRDLVAGVLRKAGREDLPEPVEEALRRIGEDHRAAIVQTHLRGRPHAEVAAEFGIPVGTLRSRVFYGLKALRLALEEMGVEP